MGRTLPWKRQGAGAGSISAKPIAKNSNFVTSSPRQSPSPSPSPSTAMPSTPKSRVRTAATNKSSSRHKNGQAQSIWSDGVGQESPGGAPKPLPEIFMIPGLQHDDKWRMVEDEFVAMAHTLTAHLHAAEYQRLKKLAQDQNADAIQSLSRPTTAPMTDRVKRRQAAVSLKKSQMTGIKTALTRAQNAQEGEVDEAPWAGTNLEGLMESPRGKMVPLTRMISTASGTRAAALSRKDSVPSAESPTTTRQRSVRFSQRQNEVEDDLEKPLVSRLSTGAISCKSQHTTYIASSTSNIQQETSSVAQVHSSQQHTSQRPSKAPSTGTANVIDDDSDSPVETMFGQHFRERRNKRRIDSSTRETSKEESQHSEKSLKKGPVRSSLSIPSF